MGTLYLCDACSQLHRIHIEVLTDCAPLKYCPACGAEALRPVKGVIDASLAGRTISPIPFRLRQLMYSTWREQFTPGVNAHPRFSTFVLFVKAMIASKGEPV